MTHFTVIYHQIKYLRRVLRQWRTSGAAALFLALTLGLCEPVLCILHCAIWVPLIQAIQPGAPHQHSMVMPDGSIMLMDGAAMAQAQPLASGAPCQMASSPQHSGHAPVAQPFHEVAPLLALLLPLVILLLGTHRPARPPAQSLRYRPPLPPPILAI